jgi:putative transposase
MGHWNEAKINFSKPPDKTFATSFNGTFREKCLNTYWFMYLKEANLLIEFWRKEYNVSHHYASLGDRRPSEFTVMRTKIRALHRS